MPVPLSEKQIISRSPSIEVCKAGSPFYPFRLIFFNSCFYRKHGCIYKARGISDIMVMPDVSRLRIVSFSFVFKSALDFSVSSIDFLSELSGINNLSNLFQPVSYVARKLIKPFARLPWLILHHNRVKSRSR